MCTGKSYYFEACGHTQSSYILICQRSESSKAKTDCDRLACTLVKDGVCPACMQIDAQIEKLRGELKGKERELNDAILLRGGAQARGILHRLTTILAILHLGIWRKCRWKNVHALTSIE